MRRRGLDSPLLVWALALTGAGCHLRADFAGTGYLCAQEAACPPGYLCVEGTCRPPAADAPPPDAAEADAGDDLDAEAPADAPPADALADDAALPDAPPPGCDWSAGPTFGTPALLAELNSVSEESDISVSTDGLTAWFTTNRVGTAGYGDIYGATRALATDPFTVAGPLAALNSADADGFPRVTDDGLVLFMHSDRGGTWDLFSATRASTADDFSAPQLLDELSDPAAEEWDPHPTPDGLAVYFSGAGPPALGDGMHHLLVARRGERSAAFGTPALVPGVAAFGNDDAAPALTADERLIVWHSARSGGKGGLDLWYATRPSRDAAFSAPVPLAALNTSAKDWKPFLRADGCELWFASERSGGAGGSDLYRVLVQP